MLTIVMNSVPVKPGSTCDCMTFKIVCVRVRECACVCVSVHACVSVVWRLRSVIWLQYSHSAPMGTSSAVTLVRQLHYLYQHHLPRHFEQW